MKVFISDLHLGDGSRTDDFHRDKEFFLFLQFVEREAEELIIVGDFLELWQADLDRVLFRHSDVINKLLSLRDKVKVTYLIGNHDHIPFVKFIHSHIGVGLEYRDIKGGLIAEHGNRYDIFNRYKNPFKSIRWPSGKHIAVMIAGLERLVHRDFDVWAKRALENTDDFLQEAIRIKNKVRPSSKEYLLRGGHFGEFEQAVKEHISRGLRIVVFGHTHRCQLINVEDGGIYANCGAWVDDVEPTYIAYHKNKIELREALTHKLIKHMSLQGV